MKKYYILMSILAVLSINLSAQQRKHMLPTATSQEKTSAFELINLTGCSSVLGYVKIGPENNDREAIVTPVDKEQWLQSLVAAKANRPIADSRRSVLYILHDISVGKTTNGNYVRIKAALYLGGENKFDLAGRVDTLVTDRAKDIDAIGGLIATAIAANIEALVLASGHANTSSFFTRDEAIRAETERYAFIRRGSTPTGIYMTYDEFKAAKPAFEHFQLKHEGESSRLIVHSFTESDSTLRPVKPWGIAIANELYFYDDNKLYAAEAIGNNLVFSKFIDPEIRKNNAAFWRMTIGDKISGKETNVFDNVNTLVLSNYRKNKLTGEAIKINSDTGAAEW